MTSAHKPRGFLMATAAVVMFMLLALVAPPSFAAPAGQAEVTASPVGTFTNNQDGTADPAFTAALNEDGTVVASLQERGGDPVVLEGKWLMGATGAVSISVREPGSRPILMVFDTQDDTLDAIRYPQSVFGDAGLTLVRVSDQAMTAEEMTSMGSGATESDCCRHKHAGSGSTRRRSERRLCHALVSRCGCAGLDHGPGSLPQRER